MVSTLRALKATSKHALVFPAAGGGLRHRFRAHYFAAVREAGLAGTGAGPHALRHSWASRAGEAGCDLVLLMQLGGWSSLQMVQRYSHHRPERAAEVIQRMAAARERETRTLSVLPQSSPRAITRAPRKR